MQIENLRFGKKYKFKTKKGATYTATFVGREGNSESYFKFDDGTVGGYDNSMITILEEVEG